MPTNNSNTVFVQVLEPLPSENIGWYCRVLAESDYSTTLAQVFRFEELSFQKDKNGLGAGSIKIDLDDPLWSQPLPAGQTVPIIDQQAIWQVYEDGLLRGEFFAEEVIEERVRDGQRFVAISGRGVSTVLQWAVVKQTYQVFPPFAEVTTVIDRDYIDVPYMDAFVDLMAEAQARGVLSFVTLTFDGTYDSQGFPWTDSGDFTVRAGTTMYQLLDDWCTQIGATWEMLSGFRLWVQKAGGNDLTDEVVFHIGGHQLTQDRRRSRREIQNKMYVYSERKNGTHITEAVDTASASKWRTREQWVEAGGAGNYARNAIGSAMLNLFGAERAAREVKVPYDTPGRRLFVDYDVNDWVRIEPDSGDTSPTDMQVLAATIKVTRESTDLELALGTRFDLKIVEIQKALQRFQNGGSVGSAASAPSTPVSSSSTISSRSIGDLKDVDISAAVSNSTIIYNNTTQVFETQPLELDLLSDVSAPSPGVGQALTWNGTAWVPVAAGAPGQTEWTPMGAPVWADEFNDGSLHADWTRVDFAGHSGHLTYTEANERLSVYHSTAGAEGLAGRYHALLIPITGRGGAWAAGDALVMGYDIAARYATNYVMVGVGLSNGTTHGTSNAIQAQTYVNTGQASFGLFRLNGSNGMNADTSNSAGQSLNPQAGLMWSRIVMTSANNWRCDWSCDGISWITHNTLAYTLTPTHMGLFVSNWTVNLPFILSVECIRRYSGVT